MSTVVRVSNYLMKKYCLWYNYCQRNPRIKSIVGNLGERFTQFWLSMIMILGRNLMPGSIRVVWSGLQQTLSTARARDEIQMSKQVKGEAVVIL
ncbi:MAG: hypothetical protein ACE5OZ_04845 [Candidatus Heimdallarchaeota archaeon]